MTEVPERRAERRERRPSFGFRPPASGHGGSDLGSDRAPGALRIEMQVTRAPNPPLPRGFPRWGASPTPQSRDGRDMGGEPGSRWKPVEDGLRSAPRRAGDFAGGWFVSGEASGSLCLSGGGLLVAEHRASMVY